LLLERKKTSSLESEVKTLKKQNQVLERELDQKDNEIVKHTSEKHKLISQIDFHRHKSLVTTGVVPDFEHASYDVDAHELTEGILRKSGRNSDMNVRLFNKEAEKEFFAADDYYNEEREEEDIITDQNSPMKAKGKECEEKKEEKRELKSDKKESTLDNLGNKIGNVWGKLFSSDAEKNKKKEEKVEKVEKTEQIEKRGSKEETTEKDKEKDKERKKSKDKEEKEGKEVKEGKDNAVKFTEMTCKDEVSLSKIPEKEKNKSLVFASSPNINSILKDNNSANNKQDKQEKDDISTNSGISLPRNFFKRHTMGFTDKTSQEDFPTDNLYFNRKESKDKVATSPQMQLKKDNNLIANYEMIIFQLKSDNQNQKNLLQESNKNIFKVKDEFQVLVSCQVEKIKTLEGELTNAREDLIKYTQSTQGVMNQNKFYEVKVINAENTIKQLQSELSACQETIKKFQNIIEDKELIVCSLQDSLRKHEIENSVLARKLAELKSAIMDQNIRMQIFTGKKRETFSTANFTLTFTKSEDEFFIVIYQEEGKPGEVTKLDDVENIKVANENENSIEFSYMKVKKLVTTVLFMNENVHQVIRIYRDFTERNMKQKNQLYY